ncbi:MAG: hypothetical protein ACW968_11760 [Candidatus Thorarchaeota archaeon]|jgi:hypothetical protein
MSRFDVAIATRRPKTLYVVVNLLKRLGIDFEICTPEDGKCDSAKVVITTEEETANLDPSRLVIVQRNSDEDHIEIEVMLKLLGVDETKEIVIGVDPGLRFGLALVVNGSVVFSRTLSSPHEAVNLTRKLAVYSHQMFPDIRFVIRLGTGSKLYYVLYLRALTNAISGVGVELVNEHHTTKDVAPRGYTTDQSSAVMIAARTGRTSSKNDLKLEPKPGYIRALKHLVAKLTNNEINLSTQDARSVLLDRTTLDSVLKDEN